MQKRKRRIQQFEVLSATDTAVVDDISVLLKKFCLVKIGTQGWPKSTNIAGGVENF
jgi:hypothetical protein